MKTKSIIFLAVFSMASAATVNAATLDPVSRASNVSASLNDLEFGSNSSNSAQTSSFDVFNESIVAVDYQVPDGFIKNKVTSTQSSDIEDNAIHYQDNVQYATGYGYYLNYQGKSDFNLTFDVASSTAFSMDWNVVGSFVPLDYSITHEKIVITKEGDANPTFYLTADFTDMGYPYLLFGSWTGCTPDDAGCLNIPSDSISGTIDAGRYTLAITNSLGASSWPARATSSSVSFNLTLAPVVPIPSTVWLMGSSLLGLAGAARMRKAQ